MTRKLRRATLKHLALVKLETGFLVVGIYELKHHYRSWRIDRGQLVVSIGIMFMLL